MIFIIPLVLGGAAAVSAIAGVTTGVRGISKSQKAKHVAKRAKADHDVIRRRVQAQLEDTNSAAEAYGQLQIEIKLRTITRFVDFIKKNGRSSKQNMSFVEGLEGLTPQQFQDYEASALEAKIIAGGGLKAAGAACATSQGTLSLIGLYGSASTGTAISSLSGAAAWNATLAWLGGGSLAAGGGGMALGTVVLGGITVGPALLLSGFTLGKHGENVLTEARKYVEQANVSIEKMKEYQSYLRGVVRHLDEFKGLLNHVESRVCPCLNELEALTCFDTTRDAALFQQALLQIQALSEILKTPVLVQDGCLNQYINALKSKYASGEYS